MACDGKLYPVSAQETSPGNGISEAVFRSMVSCIISDLNKFNLCALDNFLKRLCSPSLPDQILSEVSSLHLSGQLVAGQTVGGGDSKKTVRSDLVTWVTGEEPGLDGVSKLVKTIDCLMYTAINHPKAGQLAKYNIKMRTKVMAACYPGGRSHYLKHVDNPHGDGRVITAIYYLNSDWTEKDGGELVIYTSAVPKSRAVIIPKFDRLVFFWSDRRNPHEVKPAFNTRFAVTIWYLDEKQRMEYLGKMKEAAIQKEKVLINEKEKIGEIDNKRERNELYKLENTVSGEEISNLGTNKLSKSEGDSSSCENDIISMCDSCMQLKIDGDYTRKDRLAIS